MKEAETEEDLIQAYGVYERRNVGRTVPATEFVHAMATCGEKISKEEIEEFINRINHKDGQVNYEDFIRMMLAK